MIDDAATASDIDLCVCTPRGADHAAKVKMLNALSAALRKSKIASTMLVYRRSRVPLVAFTTISELGKPLMPHACKDLTTTNVGSYQCDISINSDGVRGVPLISKYLTSMPALRYLVFVVKSHLNRLQLGSPSTAGLASYSTILLIINYLQVCFLVFLQHHVLNYATRTA